MATAKKTQKGNFQETFEKLINDKTLPKFTEEVFGTNEFGYYMNSIQRLEIIELYDDIVDDVIKEYIENNPKVKKISEKAKQNIRSLATHILFEVFDNALYDEESDWNLTAHLLLNNYFFNEENVVAGVSASISKYGKEIESEVFKPTISAEKAFNKTHKLIGTTEWDNIIVPSEVKYGISRAKNHLELYMWDEFIKSEYNTYKLMGYTDEDIIDILNSKDTIIGFCAWCEGYAEGVQEEENK